ncbi:UNVERIFIED_CONTAM: hypothetical protein Slati_2480200 [Sesamum latifolium]|uniref:Uncharacterized protein n=1 Tax=Sesamum latifolium TaxID=2727402 RepID=A0AAW2WE67_9LAMI
MPCFQIATLTEIIDQCFTFYDKELKRSEAALEEMKKELARCQEQLKEATEGQVKWKDHYNSEVAFGRSFLKSEAGFTWIAFGLTSRKSMKVPRSLRASYWRGLTTYTTTRLGNVVLN